MEYEHSNLWETQIDIVSRFLTMIGTIEQLECMIFAVRDRGDAGRDDMRIAVSTAEACLLPLTCEMYNLMRGAATIMELMRSDSGDADPQVSLFNALSLQFSEQQKAVRLCFNRVETMACVVDFVDLNSMKNLPVIEPMSAKRENGSTSGSQNVMDKPKSTAPVGVFFSKNVFSFSNSRQDSYIEEHEKDEEEEDEDDDNHSDFASFSGFPTSVDKFIIHTVNNGQL